MEESQATERNELMVVLTALKAKSKCLRAAVLLFWDILEVWNAFEQITQYKGERIFEIPYLELRNLTNRCGGRLVEINDRVVFQITGIPKQGKRIQVQNVVFEDPSPHGNQVETE